MQDNHKLDNVFYFDEGKHNFDLEVLKCCEPVIVDFYADWCPPCKKLEQLFNAEMKSNKSFKLVKVNVDNNKTIAESYKVNGIPHVILFFSGEEIDNFVGLDVNSFKSMIEKIAELGNYSL
jgi:thioredoxin 1